MEGVVLYVGNCSLDVGVGEKVRVCFLVGSVLRVMGVIFVFFGMWELELEFG